MHCTMCGQLNDGGQFCAKCGNQLNTEPETASTIEATASADGASTRSTEPAVYVKKAKTIGLNYGNYARRLLKKPTLMSEQVDQNNFVNGVISLILFALTVPFIIYLGLNQMTSDIGIFTNHQPFFMGFVFRSIFFLAVLLLIITLVIFLYTKQCKANATYKDVVARFGAFLTIPVAIQIVALLTAIIQLSSTAIFLSSLGVVGLLVAICLTIYSYRKDLEQGIDAFYAILFTFFIMGIFFRIFGGEIISSLIFSFINPFGF